ncbi:flagellar hook-length control protein FliK [Geomonas anaerohicana]|uniref:Flagellar hook-length control protein FliK n=1 Tax=Geomonas anaerohicana TaxID=2798583 RepID=A0ABS0YHG4_9BACT|nr:flagellar hook-length control protein FliK [Geomonas anaerohicana]MBJ6751778.1 flagellar hook-length control protein FliK [Geomonas anaerohicana]
MMVQNAAFIPDAIPAPAAQSGMANAAAAPGAGVFQQLLQGRQTPGKPAETPARPTPERPAKSSAHAQKADDKARPAQAQESHAQVGEKAAPAAQASTTAKAAVDAKQQARKADPDQDAAQPAQASAAEGTGNVAQNAGTDPAQPATSTTAAGQGATAATGTVPEAQPDPNPGLVVAMAVIEPKVAARSEDANAAAGTTALERLATLQQRMQPDAVPVTTPETTPVTAGAGKAQPELPQQAAQTQQPQQPQQTQQPQQPQQQTATGSTGSQPGQKVDAAQLSPAPGKAQVVPSTGATEGAQVETPQAQVAPAAGERQQAPVLPEAAKTAVTPDQTVAATHLAAKETGAGRFVAMPVRKQAEPATVTDSGATVAAPAQESAPVQQEQAVAQDAAAQQDVTPQVQAPVMEPAAMAADSKGATVRETKPEAAAPQVKVQPEQQGETAAVSQGQAGQAEQAAQPQRKDAHQAETVTGKQVREAVQAQQVNVAKPSGEDVSGTKSATTATVNTVSELGAGRDASGTQGEQGQSHQKGQENQNGQMLGVGLTAQGTPAEAVPGETKLSGAKGQLHESILSQVREGVVTHDGKGNGQMSIRLNPGELGELKIQLRMDNNRLNVEVQADNRMVKDLLMSNLDSLREALSGKNLTMDGFNVSTGGGGFNGPLNEERGNQRQQQPQRFVRGAGYDGQDAPRVNYLTAEVNNLLDVRF